MCILYGSVVAHYIYLLTEGKFCQPFQVSHIGAAVESPTEEGLISPEENINSSVLVILF
jgi:hypothetical protein